MSSIATPFICLGMAVWVFVVTSPDDSPAMDLVLDYSLSLTGFRWSQWGILYPSIPQWDPSSGQSRDLPLICAPEGLIGRYQWLSPLRRR